MACQQDATCAAIILPKSGVVDQTACAKNALCSAVYACSVPCWDKMAACLKDTDCAPLYPDPTAADFAQKLAACTWNGMCEEVLMCQGIVTTKAAGMTTTAAGPCGAETMACAKDTDCAKILQVTVV